jgi:hypothetical protein
MLLGTAATVLLGLGFAAPVVHASPACSSSDAVCIDQTGIGIIAAGGDATTQSGYVFADGNDGNPEPLDGYIGASSADGGLVSCASGDFNRAGGNNATAGGDPTAPGPCSPAMP